jgi:hypothetical protein
MKAVFSVLVGALLLSGGAYVLLEGGQVTSQRQVLDVCALTVSAEQTHAIAPWVAGIALVAGTTLVLAGLAKRV